MEHSKEYYKIKYFKYKAKYQQAKQTGGGFLRPQWTKSDNLKTAEMKVLIQSIYSLGKELFGDNGNPAFKDRFYKEKEFKSIDDFKKFLQDELQATGDNKTVHTKTLTNILKNANNMCTSMITSDFLQICKDQITIA